MRKHTVLTVLALTLFVIIGMQLVIAQMDANVIKARVKIWPRLLPLSDYCCDYDDNDYSYHCECACKCGCMCPWARRKWIIAFITLPRGYDARDIDASSVTLQVLGGSVSVSKYRTLWRRVLIAKFDRASVIELLCPLIEHMSPWARQRVTLVVTGNLYEGNIFRGEDTITVFFRCH